MLPELSTTWTPLYDRQSGVFLKVSVLERVD